MPTPRRFGAPLGQISFVTPGSSGLNKQSETSILGPEWATIASNAVFDSSGRLSARNGWVNVTTTPISGTPIIEQAFDQVFEDGTRAMVMASNSRLYTNTSVPTDQTGTATVTAGNNWQFVNFNGNVYGFQQGEQPIFRSTGSFADIVASSGTAPTGNCAVVHSGRIWAADSDRQTIKYSALLDANAWATGAGNIDMTSVWPQGTDEIVALAMYNGLMVVFGKNRIVLFGDGQGSALGINPNNIYVVDTLVGTGCIARDTVQQIEGGDLLFLSSQGVQSLGRQIQEKSNPIRNVTLNVRDYLTSLVAGENPSQIRSVYSPEQSFYLLALPASGVIFSLDTFSPLQDGTLRVTEWNNLKVGALARAGDGTLYITLRASPTGSVTTALGRMGKYSGYQDNGQPYTFDYASAWLDMGEEASQYLKILKSMTATFFVSANTSVALKWDFDFEGAFTSRSANLQSPGIAEWGIMEWGNFEWGGGLALRHVNVPCDGSGQYLRIGAQTSINTSSFAVQQINLFTKIGRIAK